MVTFMLEADGDLESSYVYILPNMDVHPYYRVYKATGDHAKSDVRICVQNVFHHKYEYN